MDKQQIAHSLEKEIKILNDALVRLQVAYNHALDPQQARELDFTINELSQHRKNLERIVVTIVEDARHCNLGR